ncbi:MAG TPA: DNA polymerase A family protein, partial [Candidatus Paceibacterota bacterium]
SSMLKADGVIVPQRLAHDTMIMAFLKNPAARMDLKGAASIYVDKRANIGRGLLQQVMAGGNFTWATIPLDHPAYWMYGALDTCLTSLLADKLYPEIILKYREAYELELAVIHCLREAELAGMLIDPDYIERAKAKLRQELSSLREILPLANPGSDEQIRDYLLRLGVPLFALTEKGNLSVDKNVMRYFEKDFPICKSIEDFRSKSRMLGSYLEKFEELAVDNVLRASTKVVGARTSRMSVTDPPLQTLPRGRIIRDAIIARPGHRILQADYSGMEMRALASEAKEPRMLEAYAAGLDIHNVTAEALYGPDFTKPQRGVVKNAGFAKIYGAGLEQFATTAKIPVPQAKEFLERYDELYPNVKRYMEEVVGQVMERAGGRKGTGWVKLIDGRVLPVPGDKAYVAVNYRIQGSCSVVTKRKIVELDAAGLGEYFRLAVHDEMLFEVPESEVVEARKIIADVMPDRYSFPGVVLAIEQDEVDRWGQHYRGNDYPKYVETIDPPWLED